MPALSNNDSANSTYRFRWLLLGVTVLCAVAAYARAASFQFVYDDLGQIIYNPLIKSWTLALTYFRSHVWAQNTGVAMYYRPAFMLWLTANYKLFGVNPFYWHLAAIGLHVVCCILVYFLVWRLTEDQWITAVSAVLFALHPAHVETVAWVSGATDSLMAALLLGSLLGYLKHRDSGKSTDGWLWGSLLLASLAVLAKETAIILPVLIFNYQWFFPQEAATRKMRLSSAVRAAIPYGVVSLLFLIARTFALKSLTPSTRAGLHSTLPAWPQIVAFYGAHGLFPFHLTVFYNLVSVAHIGLWNFVLPLALVLAGAAALDYLSGRSRLWGFLYAWCLIMLIPMLNVTFWNNTENVHDRYLYLPSVAICVMLALGLAWLKQRNVVVATVAMLVLVLAYASVTTLELPYWENEAVLAQRGIDVSPGNPIAPQLAGNTLIRQQRPAEAVPFLVDSLAAQPGNIDTLCSLAFCYSDMNALSLAEEMIAKATAKDPSEPRVHLLLGIVRYKQKRLDEAEAEIRRGLALQRVSTGVMMYHYYLGNVLDAKGDAQGAIREYRLEARNDGAIDPAAVISLARINQIQQQETLHLQ
jgi:tetratricopeptide (TPR) repeat protein